MKFIIESVLYRSYVNDIFNMLNIPIKNISKIDTNTFLHENKIYKITKNIKEVKLAYALINENSRYYTQIYDVLAHDDCFIIIHDYIPNIKVSDDFDKAVKFFEHYISNNFNYSKIEFGNLLLAYENQKDFTFHLKDDTLKYLNILKNLFMNLQLYGILKVSNLTKSNIGFKNGEYKFYNLHFEKGTEKNLKTIKKL